MKMGDSLEKVRETKNHNNQNSRIMETINIKAYTNKPYNPEFVEKINKSKKQIAEGKFTEVKVDDLKAFIDSL